MWRSLSTTCAVAALACGAADVDDYDVVSSSVMLLAERGAVPNKDCRQVGILYIPERDISLISRLSGAHLEAFFASLNSQAARFEANYLLPTGSVDAATAAASGEDFHASLFHCPP